MRRVGHNAGPKVGSIEIAYLCMRHWNGHHQKWLGSTTTNRHGVVALDFATASGCDHPTTDLTQARGGTLDNNNNIRGD